MTWPQQDTKQHHTKSQAWLQSGVFSSLPFLLLPSCRPPRAQSSPGLPHPPEDAVLSPQNQSQPSCPGRADVYGVIISCWSLLVFYRGILSRESALSSPRSLRVTFMGDKGNCSTAAIPNVPGGHCLGAGGSSREHRAPPWAPLPVNPSPASGRGSGEGPPGASRAFPWRSCPAPGLFPPV